MKFTTALVVFGLVAAAAAAESSSTTSTAVPTATLSPEQKCLQSCTAGDVSCQSTCLGNPNPDASMVNATTACAAKCPQGDGTQAATDKYAACQQDCIKKYFFSSGATGATATDAATGTTADATATATGTGTSKAAATGTGASGTHAAASGTHTGTGSSSTSSASASSAPANGAGTVAVSGAAGILAMVAAAFAL